MEIEFFDMEELVKQMGKHRMKPTKHYKTNLNTSKFAAMEIGFH